MSSRLADAEGGDSSDDSDADTLVDAPAAICDEDGAPGGIKIKFKPAAICDADGAPVPRS